MADNIFNILLNGSQKTRAKKETNNKLRTILNNPESTSYERNPDTEDTFSDFDDFTIGEERDKTDHLSDIDKLSMKDLDKKSSKEQLKILKLEYNRVFDKLNTLNKTVANNERLISDLQLERRTDEEEVRNMRNLIRKIVHLFPGYTNIKDIVDQGTWEVNEVFEDIANIVVSLLNKVREVDAIIEEEVGKIKEENTMLKERVLQYKALNRQFLEQMEQIEELLNQKQGSFQGSSSNDSKPPKIEITPPPTPPTIDFTETKDDSIEEEESITPIETPTDLSDGEAEPQQNTTEHNPHFSDFFNEFKTSFEKMKKEENLDKSAPSSTDNKGDERISASKMEKSPMKEASHSKDVQKHPLSPDYIETEKEIVDDFFDETIDAYLQNLSVQQEFLLKVIGKTGISRNSDLKDYLKTDEQGQQYYFVGKKYNSNALNRDIAELRDKSILSDEQVSYGGKGGGNFNVYELSSTGKSCYKKITEDNPVIPEKKRIKDIHASLEHGYLIKDSAKLFREMGYKVYTDLDDVSFKIDPKHRKVFDFIVEDDEGKLMHIEVERGTHTQEGFSNAMDKIYEITKEFYFICPNETVKNKNTKKKFFTWVTKTLGGIQKADVILNMTTIEQLRKKQKNLWEVTDLRQVK
ncbi:hypothetical protein AAGG74_18555 [Bacillus mexicanus]|uniref:hypothetical protein n=1 Tax=Bacillus mexicanus TaxID=2834415 RepID=UPI003D25AADE